jgi:Holliday junction resolvase
MSEASWRNEQADILAAMADDDRLLSSAKNHIQVMLGLLTSDETIGFDTTSALFYAFLHNSEFTDSRSCPLSARQIREAKQYFRSEAQISRAKETALLRKLAALPLADFFGGRMDLRDLAVAFLTYASEVRHFTYNPKLAEPLYDHLRLPRELFLNVYDLYYGLEQLQIPYHDLMVSLSRLRFELAIPAAVKTLSIIHGSAFDGVLKGLPRSLQELDGTQLEDFIMEAYERAGFSVVRIGGRATAADGGVDIIALSKDSGLRGDIRIAIQCKATANRVDSAIIRGFNGALSNFAVHKGVLIARSGFTRAAILEASEQRYPIDLMDYVRLTNALRGLVKKE